jgi:hypothetical protein
VACTALLAGAVQTSARTLADVELPETISVDDATLHLNGMGLREATVLHVKAYVGGLYLEKPSHDADTVIDSKQRKRVTMVFLRDISKKQLASGWADSLRAVAPDESAAIGRFMELVPDVKKRGRMEFTFRPGQGVEIAYDGKPRGTIEGDGFARALLTVWFGPKPGDPNLKKGMLGN